MGGLITSTAKAEAEGKNHFSTDRLVREEIHNYSNYKGKSIALGVSAVLSGDTLEQGEAQRREFMDVGKSGVGKTFGIGREQRSQEGVTIGSVNTANLTIGDDAGQRLLTGESAAEAAKNANRGITLEHVKEHNGTTSVSFDADKVTRDITSTAQVMQGFDGTTQGIKHDLRKQADAYRERGDEETAAKLDKLTIGVDMLKGGLTPTDSALGTIANTAAPLVSYQIGQYAKAHGSEGSAGHIAAHAALAALTSAANGGSGTDMATSAAITGAAEYSAPLVAKGFYGTSDSSKLTAEQKETISNILGLAAAGAGAAVGNSTTAYGASRAAGNAVDNNYYLTYTALEPKQSIADNKKTYEILKDTVKARCTESAAECEQYTQYIIDFIQDERFKENYAAEQKESLQYLKDNPRIVENYETRKKIKFELEDNSKLHRYVLPSAEMAGGFAQAAASAVAMSACLESGGATCYLGTAGFVSATDHVMTGADNFGARRSQQRQTTMVNTLKGLGLSEGAAANSQLMLDVGSGFATAARGAAIAHARTYSVTPKFLPESATTKMPSDFKAGAGGSWKVMDEISNPEVVKQINNVSCGAACGEMLLKDRNIFAKQTALGLEVKSTNDLARDLNKLGSGRWQGNFVSVDSLEPLNKTGSWAAMMWEKGEKIGHWVVVKGSDKNGKMIIHDPWHGTSYKMTRDEFTNYWTGGAVYEQ
ncbi:Peptidase C39 family [Cardiobacterium hominis]|uniref:VENN motif pre-toxin domain-containing protein n=1 Tax=Cardiobacterium hominis TaxID=2718 RepID=UPI000F6DBBDB|nr:VENN motif pre-toxin domain-containing protein [Cardiobacterium hominis]VEG78402.1 Peptidase C39 family [Cardiobacterium hominis]